MIDQLPAEIVQQILGHLTAVSSIANVSATNRKLRQIVAEDSSSIYRTFTERCFPSIAASPPWQEAAFRLTSRARAWDRRALIARECAPPQNDITPANRNSRQQTFGYIPVIDSYEIPSAGSARGTKQVLAWGAAGRLRVRTTEHKSIKWSSWRIENDASPLTDILDVRLLRPNQNLNRFGESVFIRRANREMVLLNAMPEEDSWVPASRYTIRPEIALDCVDINNDSEPLLAVCESHSLQLFQLHSGKESNRAETVVPLIETNTIKQRKRCAKFISESRLAIATQHLEGLTQAPIELFDISPSGLSSTPLVASKELRTAISPLPGRKSANVLAKVDSSDLLLSGWTDGLVRLYDLRSGSNPVRDYSDPVDDGQILSLLPIGQERFLAGSHQNACLKTFDMRMGSRVYDLHHSAPPLQPKPKTTRQNPTQKSPGSHNPTSRRDINVFLALTVHRIQQSWQPLPGRHSSARLPRYRGSIYSLSSPSPSSPTVYAGIENHVIQLNFVSTDDYLANRGGVSDPYDERPILNLSCYERPRPGHESTDTVLLRKQADMDNFISSRMPQADAGWDERWQLDRQRTRRGMTANWYTDRPRRT